MNKAKNTILIIIGITAGLCLAFYVYFYIGFSQSKRGVEQAMKRFTPGTIEYETYKRWNARADAYYAHTKKAEEYIQNNQYDMALAEYDKAYKMNYNKWITHTKYLDLYEASGQYDKALRVIAIMKQLRPDMESVQERLTQRESSIKEKMSQQ